MEIKVRDYMECCTTPYLLYDTIQQKLGTTIQELGIMSNVTTAEGFKRCLKVLAFYSPNSKLGTTIQELGTTIQELGTTIQELGTTNWSPRRQKCHSECANLLVLRGGDNIFLIFEHDHGAIDTFLGGAKISPTKTSIIIGRERNA